MTPLHQVGEALRSALLLVPLPLVRVLFVATLAAVLLWVLCLPREATTPSAGARRWDENLKITAAIALLIYVDTPTHAQRRGRGGGGGARAGARGRAGGHSGPPNGSPVRAACFAE